MKSFWNTGLGGFILGVSCIRLYEMWPSQFFIYAFIAGVLMLVWMEEWLGQWFAKRRLRREKAQRE